MRVGLKYRTRQRKSECMGGGLFSSITVAGLHNIFLTERQVVQHLALSAQILALFDGSSLSQNI